MNAILRILLEITIFSIVLYAAIMLFKRLFRRHISPVLGYAVWVLLILRLMIPVTIDSETKLFVIPEAATAPIQTTSDISPQPEYMPETDTGTPEFISDNDTHPSDNMIPASQPDSSASANIEITVTPNASVSRPIQWQTVLVMLWALGIAVSAGLLLLLFGRIQRKNKRGSSAPDPIISLVDACKRDMGIKANIKVLVQDWLTTPALTASLRPKLLLPKSMLNGMDMRQIEYGIRHELMHYRRRDHLAALLLMLLRCVYWFNPVVWLASKQIETDMEAACDASVTASLNRLECFDYAQTMIDLGSKANAYMLGMGVSNSCRSMEQRVRGIFMCRCTKLPVRLAALVLSCLLIFTCFTTACQPVQAEPANNTAAAETQTETAQAPAEPVPAPAPEVNPNEGYGNFPDWVETYTIPNLTVDINAQIVTPNTDVFPVYKVKKRTFDEETMQKIVDYFAGDAVGVRDFSYTEDELKEQLASEKKYTNDKETLNRLKEEIKNVTPETFSPVKIDTPLTGRYIYLMDNGDKVYTSIYHNEGSSDEIHISKYSYQYGIQPERWIRDGGPERLVKPMEKALDSMDISEEEARDQAAKVISDLGIDYMGIAGSERAIVVNGYTDDVMSGGWLVSIARKDGNSIPISYFQVQPSGMFREDEFAKRWFDESLDIYVDDGGVQSFSWDNTIDITEVTEENATLMPFDDVKQTIKNNIELDQQFVFSEHGIKINKIVLANVVVPVSDDLDYQMLVPSWLVYYKEIPPDRFDYTNVFAVNAIDGTPINLMMRGHVTDEDLAQINAENK